MCTSTVRTQVYRSGLTACSKRFLHRSPDVFYLTTAYKNSFLDPQFSMEVKEVANYIASNAPGVYANYAKTTAAMVAKGKVPFVHGQSAGWSAPMLFTQYFSSKNFGFFKFLRPPTSEYWIERKDLDQRISDYISKHGTHPQMSIMEGTGIQRLDQDSRLRPHLLSASYALMGNVSPYESASFFAFSNGGILNREKEWKFSEKFIRNSLQKRGLKDKYIQPLVTELKACFEGYCSQKIGNIVVIGFPREKISHFAYDSYTLGYPTGHAIEEVSKNPRNYRKSLSNDGEGGLQARIRIFKDTLNPSSGIDVIVANDEAEVEAYCKGVSLTPFEEIDVFKPFVNKSSPVEEAEQRKRKALDERVKAIAQEARKMLT